MPLFEVAITIQPTKKEQDEGTGKEQLVFGPKAVIAKNQESAAIAAIMGDAKALEVDMSRATVLVRPFA